MVKAVARWGPPKAGALTALVGCGGARTGETGIELGVLQTVVLEIDLAQRRRLQWKKLIQGSHRSATCYRGVWGHVDVADPCRIAGTILIY